MAGWLFQWFMVGLRCSRHLVEGVEVMVISLPGLPQALCHTQKLVGRVTDESGCIGHWE
jgi:hypothetical protein